MKVRDAYLVLQSILIMVTAVSPGLSDPSRGEFAGKTALVLGASRGIGAETAVAFGRAGARVILASRNEADLQTVAQRVHDAGGVAVVVPTDLADPASLKRLGSRIDTEGAGLHVAFNNAGEGHTPSPLADVPTDAFERVLRVTVMGTFLALQEEIPRILQTGGGSIVNMSSTAGLASFAGGASYVAAKHAIIGLTKSAALDYAARGLRVNAVAPGPIDTHRLQAAPEEYRARARAAIPMRRLGEASEVADVVLWLSSSRAAFVTGTTVTVDGGKMAGAA
jgi:NAD(P)-dependent dehydrogenase (short-subunit alcohol dehydrogenase family)